MASNHSREKSGSAELYPFIIDPATPKPILGEYVALRDAQQKIVVALGRTATLQDTERETLYTLTLELGLQQSMLQSAMKS